MRKEARLHTNSVKILFGLFPGFRIERSKEESWKISHDGQDIRKSRNFDSETRASCVLLFDHAPKTRSFFIRAHKKKSRLEYYNIQRFVYLGS